MSSIAMLGLDVIFLAPILYFIVKKGKLTNLVKCWLTIYASLIIGDLLIGLGYSTDLIRLGQSMAWVFFTVMLVYFYILEKGVKRRELLNMGGAVIFAPLLLFIGNNINFPLILCYGIGLIAFSWLLSEEGIELRTSGAFGITSCGILLAMYSSQIIWQNPIDPALLILPRAVLLASLTLFGYIAIIPSECVGIRITGKTRSELKGIVPSVIKLKSERRAIHSEMQAMLNELKRIKKDMSSSQMQEVYTSLKAEYTKEVTMLRKATSGKLREMKETEMQLRERVEVDKKALATLKKELEEEKRVLQKVKDIISEERETTENVVKELENRIKKGVKWPERRRK